MRRHGCRTHNTLPFLTIGEVAITIIKQLATRRRLPPFERMLAQVCWDRRAFARDEAGILSDRRASTLSAKQPQSACIAATLRHRALGPERWWRFSVRQTWESIRPSAD